MTKRKPLREFRPLQVNPNKHTPRGMKLLKDAIQRDGYVAPMTAVADGTIIDGNARLETVATAMPSDPIVIEHDGRRPIIAVRTDIPDADDPRAKRIAIAANRIAEVDLDWDKDILGDLGEEDLAGLWTERELDTLLRESGHGVIDNPVREVSELADPKAAEFQWAKTAVVEFSGGRDSTAALLWAKTNLPQARLIALHVDLGADYPGFLFHVIRVVKTVGCELQEVRTERNIFEGLAEKGWPIWVGPWCQDWMHRAIDGWIKANCVKEETLILRGTRSKQKKRFSKLAQNAELPSMPGWKRCDPIFDWTDASVRRILDASGVPIWSGYALGLPRTACWCCPGQRPVAYTAMRRAFPSLFRAYQELEAALGEGQLWHKPGWTIARAADRGEEMLAASNVAEDDDGEVEGGE